MKRTVLLVLAVAALAMAAPAALANHSTSTGINCSNFAFQEDAQAYFDLHPGDPEGLDGPIGPAFSGIQNVACEDLPRRGLAATTTTAVTTATTIRTTTTLGTTTTTQATTTTLAPATTTTSVVATAGRVLALTG